MVFRSIEAEDHCHFTRKVCNSKNKFHGSLGIAGVRGRFYVFIEVFFWLNRNYANAISTI